MEARLIKTFTAGADIEAHLPVTVEDGKVVLVTSPFQLVKGVTTHKVARGEAVDVLVFGEGLVKTTGAVDGKKWLVASKDGSVGELDLADADLASGGLACIFANPIETASSDAILNCFICPQLLTIPAV